MKIVSMIKFLNIVMVKSINVINVRNKVTIYLFNPNLVINHSKYSLFYGKKHERVYTESEVKAILHDMRSWISPDDGEEGRMWENRQTLIGVLRKF